jgi:hypothetical protein
MMLRSAEADPHVIEHVPRGPTEADLRDRANLHPPSGAEAPSCKQMIKLTVQGCIPRRVSGESLARGPKASGWGRRDRSREPLVDLLGNHRSGNQT